MIRRMPHRHPPHPGIVAAGGKPGLVHDQRGDLRPLLIRQLPVTRSSPHRTMPDRLTEPRPAQRRQRLIQSLANGRTLADPSASRPGSSSAGSLNPATRCGSTCSLPCPARTSNAAAPQHPYRGSPINAPLRSVTEWPAATAPPSHPAAGSPANRTAPPEPDPPPPPPSHSASPPPGSGSSRPAAPDQPPSSPPPAPPAAATAAAAWARSWPPPAPPRPRTHHVPVLSAQPPLTSANSCSVSENCTTRGRDTACRDRRRAVSPAIATAPIPRRCSSLNWDRARSPPPPPAGPRGAGRRWRQLHCLSLGRARSGGQTMDIYILLNQCGFHLMQNSHHFEHLSQKLSESAVRA